MYGKTKIKSASEALFDANFNQNKSVETKSKFLGTLKEDKVFGRKLTIQDCFDENIKVKTVYSEPCENADKSSDNVKSELMDINSSQLQAAVKPSKIREIRTKSLKEKSHSSLLLDLLFARYEVPELRKIAKEFCNIDLSSLKKLDTDSRLPSKSFASPKRKLCTGGTTIGCWKGSVLNPLVLHLIKTLGADVEYTDSDGHFPLLLAIQYSNSSSLVTLLLECEANVMRCAPISPEFVPSSFTVPADVNEDVVSSAVLTVKSNRNYIFSPPSLVDISYRLGQTDVCKLLLKHGALPTLFDENAGDLCNADDSILDYARIYGFHGAMMNIFKLQLNEAIERDDLIGVKTVLSHKFSPDLSIDSEGRTPLYRAIHEKKSLDILKALLAGKSDPNKLDKNLTPMIVYPLMRGDKLSEQSVKLLLDYGSDLNIIVPSTNETVFIFSGTSCVSKLSRQLIKKAYNNNP